MGTPPIAQVNNLDEVRIAGKIRRLFQHLKNKIVKRSEALSCLQVTRIRADRIIRQKSPFHQMGLSNLTKTVPKANFMNPFNLLKLMKIYHHLEMCENKAFGSNL